MAVIAMHDAVVKLDNAGGTPVDISGQSNSIQINVENVVGEHFTFDTRWAKTTQGGKRGTGVIQILEKPDTGQAHEIASAWLLASPSGDRTITMDTPDSQAGSLRYSGEFAIENLNPLTSKQAGSGDVSLATLNVKLNGALTKSVIT